MVLVDSNVILDIVTDDPTWRPWSRAMLSEPGPFVINDIVYAELSVGYQTRVLLDEFLSDLQIGHLPMTSEACFAAGKAFHRYRRQGGTRTGVLPDFFIGAQAQASGMPLLTRDAARYRSYFPGVALIAPAENM